MEGPDAQRPEDLRTKGGEPVIVRQANGRLQLRHAPPGRMTDAAARHILATVEETNNLRLAARAAGFAHTSLIAKARAHPGFGRELAIARRIGQDRVLYEDVFSPGRADPDDWEPADRPLAKMTVDQAMLQLVYHRPDGVFARSWWHRRRPPRGIEVHAPRIRAKISALKRGIHYEATGSWRYPEEEED